MKRSRLGPFLVVALLLSFHPGVGWAFDLDVSCPADVTADLAVTAPLRLENGECSPAEVRFISSIGGNAAQNLGGIGIVGPVVIDSAIAVPAATDNSPPGCFDATPGVFQNTQTVSPVVPASLVGTVASIVFIAEWRLGGNLETTLVKQCLVNVQP